VILSIQPETDTLIAVTVSDTGIGIPHNRLQEIFEPFHQLDASSTRHFGGTGLGLALAQEIVSAHGSMIKVESEEERGSTFRFALLAAGKHVK
jgi:signal transduction histidine kinase